MQGFLAPQTQRPVDIERHVRLLPAKATCKGLYFIDLQRRAKTSGVDTEAKAGVEARRYLPFHDYPFADYLRLAAATAAVVARGVSPGEGLRQLGSHAYDTLLASQVGKVVFGAFGGRFDLVARHGNKGWGVSLSFGRYLVIERGANEVLYRFEQAPVLIETLQVGVVEGAMKACGVSGEVLVKMGTDVDQGELLVRWR